MKKSILVILIIVAFVAVTMFVLAQAAKESTDIKGKPAKATERTLTKRTPIERAAEKGVAIPVQVGSGLSVPEAEKAAPIPVRTQTVRLTEEQIAAAVAAKGIDVGKKEDRARSQLPEIMKPLMPDTCEFRPDDNGDCCYTYTTFRWFTGPNEEAVQFTDPEYEGPRYGSLCPAETKYPVEIYRVSFHAQADDECTVVFKGGIRDVDWSDPTCPYPGALIYETSPETAYFAGGVDYIYVDFPDPVCVNDRYFASFTFVEVYGAGPGYTAFGVVLDLTNDPCNAYDDWGVGWVDLNTAGAYPGAIRLRSYGLAADQNDCPIDTTWYWKYAVEPYLPSGIPDFDQYQMGGVGEGAYSAPAAVANCLKWVYCGGFPSDLIEEGDFGPLVCADTSTIPEFIGWLADLMGTDPTTGTGCCDSIQAGLEKIKPFTYEWLTETTYYFDDDILFPTPEAAWNLLQYQLRLSQDVILGIGFWYDDPTGGGWKRIGGNYVTMAGVNKDMWRMAVSDPSTDAMECGFCPFGRVLGAPHAPVCGMLPWGCLGLHNNNFSVSHDGYQVAQSPSPGGILQLEGYGFEQGPAYIASFVGQNFPAKFVPFAGPMPAPEVPIYTEIECAVVICPGTKYANAEVWSDYAIEINNNQGGIEGFYVDCGAGYTNHLYYGSILIGTSQTDLNCDYGDYPAEGQGYLPAGPIFWDYFPMEGEAGTYYVENLIAKFNHSLIDGLEITMYTFGFWVPAGGTEDCGLVLEDVYVLHNNSETDIIGLEKAMWLDYDYGEDYADLSDGNQQYQSKWMWNPTDPVTYFGMTLKPSIAGEVAVTGWGVAQASRVYDNEYLDSLKYWMENLGWGDDNPGVAEDRSILISSDRFDIPAGGYHIEKFLKWGYCDSIAPGGDDENWRHFLYNVLHQEGFYRGDADKDGDLDVSDVIYQVNYLFKSGPVPIEFKNQMDVDCDGDEDVSDVIYCVNYLYKLGPAPIDKNRFFLESPYVDPDHKAAYQFRDPGLFGDPDWKDLGK